MRKLKVSSGLSLVIIMACIVVGSTLFAAYMLYRTALANEAEKLQVTAQSQARLIESIARFDGRERADYPGGSYAATLTQIREAHESYLQFGATGELTLARLEGNEIVFLLRHRELPGGEDPWTGPDQGQTDEGLRTVTFGSGLAEPMEHALSGEAGTMVGKDYMGYAVLAAYEPLNVHNLGIVAKINMAEIRAPYLLAVLVTSGISLLLIAIGTLWFGRITSPMLLRIGKSEELWRSLTENSPDTVMELDCQLVIERVNRARPGLKREEMEGRSAREYIRDEEQARVVNSLSKVLATGEEAVYEISFLTPSGDSLNFESRAVARRLNGKVVGLTIHARDITDRIKAEKELQAQKEQAQSYLDIAGVILVILDETGHIVQVNRKCCEILGQSEVDLLGQDWFEVCLPDSAQAQVKEVFRKLMAGEIELVDYYENEIVTKSNEARHIAWNNRVIYDASGSAKGVVSSGEDITQRRVVEEKIRESENRFRTMFELHSAVMLLIDPGNGEIVDANTSATEFYGYTIAQLKSMKISQINSLSPGDTDEKMQLALGRKQSYFNFRHHLASGESKWVEVYSTPIHVGEDRLLFSIIHDISERKEVENALRASENKYRELVANMGEGLAMVDTDENVVFANPAAERIFGLGEDELVGRNLRDFLDDDNTAVVESQTRRRQQGLTNSYEVKFLRPDGELRDVIATVSPSFDNQGKFKNSIGIFRDITESKKAETQLVEARNLAVEANQSKSRFLSNMSHELRTPLAIINGSAEVLLENHIGPLNQQQEKFIKLIKDNGDHLLMIINDLLDLAKIEAGKLLLEMDNLDLAALSKETCTMIELKVHNAGLEIELEGMEQAVLFYGDRFRLKQVLLNLLSNALKFTKKGTITTYLRTDNGQIEWGVRDTGIGINDSVLSKLFQPFEQGEEILRKEIKGTGLGLALSKQIIQAHGGQIQVTSALGKGSDFRILVPAERAAQTKDTLEFD